MNGRTFLAAMGVAALLSASNALSQGRSGGAAGGGNGMGGTVSSTARGGGMAGGMGAMGPASPMGVGAGSLLTGIDRATEATSGNANATAGFTSAMDLRAAAQNRRTTARANAQAKAHANAMAKDKANTNSVLNDPDD